MRLKQTGALLLASVMMVGTIGMMNPTQVQAADPAPTNQYTLTVPAETTLAYDGSAEALTNGLKVSGGDLEDGKKVTVTATSAGDWKLSASGATTKISYGLYATAEATEATTSWDFSKTEAAGTTGTTKTIYSKIVASEYASAQAGDYSDTITFTAKVVGALTKAQVTSLVDAVGTDKFFTSTNYPLRNALPFGGDGGDNDFAYNMTQWGANFSMGDNGNYVFEKDEYKYEVVISEGKATSVIQIKSLDGDVTVETFTAKVAPTPAPVTVKDVTINAAEGMTWAEIAAINLNVEIVDGRVMLDGERLRTSTGYVTPEDVFTSSVTYR